jgi:hypothetical protein
LGPANKPTTIAIAKMVFIGFLLFDECFLIKGILALGVDSKVKKEMNFGALQGL